MTLALSSLVLRSTFTKVRKSHGNDGRYIVLAVGSLANLSDDFMVLYDFLGRALANSD